MDTVELIDEIRQKAYKEGLDDFGLNLIVREILKPLDLSAKRKQEIIKQFSPIPSQPKNLPSPNTPVLVDEIIDVWFPFTTLNPDIDKAKRFLLQIVEESRDGMWVQMKRSRTEVTGIIGDTTAEATV